MIASLVVPVTVIGADSTDGSGSHDLSLSDLMNLELQSGSFLDLDLASSPFSMTVIDRRQIENSGSRHLAELLEIHVPGFQYMYNKWNGTIWGMRGVANDRNTKFIFLINGHKMNSESRDGFIAEASLGLLGDIERVEVLRGPAGLVYGSGAIAGIVNIVTRDADAGSGEIAAGLGSWQSGEFEARTVARPEGGASLNFALGARRSAGIGLHEARLYGRAHWPYPAGLEPGKPEGVPVDGSAWATPGNYRLSADIRWDRFRWYSRATRQSESAGGMFIRDPWPEAGGTPDSALSSRMVDGRSVAPTDPFWSQTESFGTNRRQYRVDNVMSELSFTLPLGEDEIELKAGVDGLTNRIQLESRPGYESDLAANPKPFIDETFGERRYTASSMYLLNRISGLQAAAGVEVRLDDLGEDLEGRNAKGENPLHPVISEVAYANLAGYSEGLYRVNPRLGIHLGIRYDLHTRTARFGGTVNPKAAALIDLAKGQTLKAIVQSSSNNGSADNYEFNRWHYNDKGEIHNEGHFEFVNRPPDASTNVLPGVPTDAVLHRLRPEKVYSYELASSHSFRDFLVLQTSFSFNQVRDLFAWNQTLFRVVNVGEYEFVDLELDAALRLDRVSLGLSHAWQRPVKVRLEEQSQSFYLPHYDKTGAWYDSALVNGRWQYRPIPSSSIQDTVNINLVRDQITQDGENFLSLATHISKVFVDYTPLSWLTLHSDIRIFWGLAGRDRAYSRDRAQGFPTLFIENTPMYKWNVSGHLRLPAGIRISAYAYDLLGVDPPDSRGGSLALNTLRWQQMAQPDQKDLYGLDRRSYSLKLEKSF